ncbi:MAG: hypothetical protein LBU53_08515 [Zoogloeaceae bacterium]|jgi:hypothetical protein|nr:hypothetical protein [Zoogloeaceae bacterium]
MDLKLQILMNAVDRVTGPMKKMNAETSAMAEKVQQAKDALRALETQRQKLEFRRGG